MFKANTDCETSYIQVKYTVTAHRLRGEIEVYYCKVIHEMYITYLEGSLIPKQPLKNLRVVKKEENGIINNPGRRGKEKKETNGQIENRVVGLNHKP